LELLQKDNWQVGGEASGHVLCMDKHNTGDGIISALQVLSSLQVLGLSLEQATQDWHPFPQTMINVRIQKGQAWQEASKVALAEAETALVGIGRVVLRPSGTEPVVRVMVEAQDKALADQYAKLIADAILA
jgi:phosphoglucosamine mutase